MTTSFPNSLIISSLIAALIGFILLFYVYKINKDAHLNYIRIGFLLIAQLFLFVLSIAVSDTYDDKQSRIQLQKFLAKNDLSITIEGELLDSIRTKEISIILNSISTIAAHHSSPVDSLKINLISGSDTFKITLGQDSQYPTEFWVFEGNQMINEIGRIRTHYFLSKNGI